MKWQEEFNGGKRPSVRQIINGMVWWMVERNEDRMKTVKSVKLIKNSKRSTENIMKLFLGKLNLHQSEWDKPLE